jgi:hypothetical protein
MLWTLKHEIPPQVRKAHQKRPFRQAADQSGFIVKYYADILEHTRSFSLGDPHEYNRHAERRFRTC